MLTKTIRETMWAALPSWYYSEFRILATYMEGPHSWVVVPLIVSVLETLLEPQVWMGKCLGEAKVTVTLKWSTHGD